MVQRASQFLGIPVVQLLPLIDNRFKEKWQLEMFLSRGFVFYILKLKISKHNFRNSTDIFMTWEVTVKCPHCCLFCGCWERPLDFIEQEELCIVSGTVGFC